jgi:hypothetical protein
MICNTYRRQFQVRAHGISASYTRRDMLHDIMGFSVGALVAELLFATARGLAELDEQARLSSINDAFLLLNGTES